MIKTSIEDGFGSGNKACVTHRGQLITAPVAYDETEFRELDVENTAYNFYKPIPGKQFVLTGLIVKADKQVSSTVDADVVVYEADAEDTLTVGRVLLQMAMTQGDLVPMTPLNIQINPGVFINAKTTDDDIHMTIMGYYAVVEE